MYNANVSIDCGFGHRYIRRFAARSAGAMAAGPGAEHKHFVVAKTHQFILDSAKVLDGLFDGSDTAKASLSPRQKKSMMWVWESRMHNHTPQIQHHLDQYQLSPVLTVDRDDVQRDGIATARDAYVSLLRLGTGQSKALYEWLELWDTLRVCCGVQMSDSWRHHLSRTARGFRSFSGSSSSNDSRARVVRLCSDVNLTDIEAALMHTELYRRMGQRVELLTKPSLQDGALTGRYCQVCEHNVRTFNLSYNKPCVWPPSSSLSTGEAPKVHAQQQNHHRHHHASVSSSAASASHPRSGGHASKLVGSHHLLQ